MIKHYVEFMLPGLIVSESCTKGIPLRIPVDVEVPKHCYAFRFFDVEEIVFDRERFSGQRKNYSGYYFVNGELLDYDQVAEKLGNDSICARNMKCNGKEHVFASNSGGHYPFDDKDVVLKYQ